MAGKCSNRYRVLLVFSDRGHLSFRIRQIINHVIDPKHFVVCILAICVQGAGPFVFTGQFQRSGIFLVRYHRMERFAIFIRLPGFPHFCCIFSCFHRSESLNYVKGNRFMGHPFFSVFPDQINHAGGHITLTMIRDFYTGF